MRYLLLLVTACVLVGCGKRLEVGNRKLWAGKGDAFHDRVEGAQKGCSRSRRHPGDPAGSTSDQRENSVSLCNAETVLGKLRALETTMQQASGDAGR